ncbi:TKL family protein kinase [Ectocarpus siliculosus]|uniref:TKL family protein kinase n=1 Tax=Ectocarpus siliculosus TaxID=2880 RepID=D8LJD1_ECTSI|nr:TKL family protein kinase [Ectocarpus siliculosus]|eukprot:CBN79464.1 TKL family protein kinase [Ectocarpus siliculosus]
MVDKVTPELRNFMAWNFRVAPKILNLAEVVGVVAKKELRKPSVLVELRIWEARDVLQMGSCEEELAAGTKAAEHRKDVGVQLDHGLLIGKGGSANVYLVDYLGKNRAVKKITNGETPTTELEVMKTLLNESAHIVRIIIGGPTSEHRMMLMMEYMPGGDLATFISSCKDNKDNKDKLEKHRLGFLRDICDGMAYIHDKGLVHRDLKSANVLLSENLEAKIADFGLTKGENDATTKAYNFTTHSHAAPEVFDKRILKGKPGGWERDVYAFAIICWELVAVDKPWRDKHTGEPQSKDYIMSAVLEGTRPPIPQDAPPNLIGVMGQGWHRELTKRPTAARLKRMLNEVTDDRM